MSVVVKLGAGEAESALRQAGVWSRCGDDESTLSGATGSSHDRQRVAGALARAAVTKALGGYTPPWVTVRGSEIPGGQIVVRKTDPDGSAIVRVEVAIARLIEDSTFTVVGWVWGRERNLGVWRGDWTSPAHIMPRLAQRDISKLRDAIMAGSAAT